MEELKPCPFCGGRAVYNTIANKSGCSSVGFTFVIECKDCETKLPSAFNVDFDLTEDGKINVLNDMRSLAIRTWNTRTN